MEQLPTWDPSRKMKVVLTNIKQSMTGSNGKVNPEEDALSKEPSNEEATGREAAASVPPPKEERQGFWAKLRELLDQMSELRVEMPDLSLEETKKNLGSDRGPTGGEFQN